MRVPYPLGFYAKGVDGRIDPNGGWKGRGLWTTYGNARRSHRGRQGHIAKVVKFQIRPDPLRSKSMIDRPVTRSRVERSSRETL